MSEDDRHISEILDDPEAWLREVASERTREGWRTDRAIAAILVLILWRRLDAIEDSLRLLLEYQR